MGARTVNLLSDSDTPPLNPFVGSTCADNSKICTDLAPGNAGVRESAKTIDFLRFRCQETTL